MALDSTATEGLSESELRTMVDVAGELTESSREHSEVCRDYYDSHQWTAAEKSVLAKRKQPILTVNRVKRKIDAVVGIEQKGRVDPRALPRNPQDEQGADVATKALVFIDDLERFDVKRSAFCYNLSIEGTGGIEVCAKEKKGVFDPCLIRLRWEELFYDPFSRELDFSDAGYTGVQKWMTVETAIEFCNGYDHGMEPDELRSMLERTLHATGQTYEDRPAEAAGAQWGDRTKKRIKLAYLYYKHGGAWRLALLCGGGTIYDEPSPYLDENGKPENAMILQSCYIDRENRRYGIVTDMISMQDEVNKRRSKLLHQLNSRQTQGQKGSVDVAKVKRELALPDGHVEYEQDPQSTFPSFQIIPQSDQISGQFELLQESKAEIDMLGPNASLLGQL
jgi:hypothetical protein